MAVPAAPLVSVIVPAHNAAPHLERALRSVLHQTIPALEALVVDDASTDETRRVAEAMAQRDRRVRVIPSPRNLGPAGARNLGLEVARGSWIALLDSDDAYRRRRLERLLAAAGETGADMVADDLLLRGEDQSAGGPMLAAELGGRPRRIDAAAFLIGNLPVRGRERVSYGFLKPMVRRAFLEEHRLRYDARLRFAEDFDLYLRCLIAGARFWLIPDPGYAYTVRRGSITATHGARDLLRLRGVDRRLLRRPEVAADPRLRDALRRHARSVDDRLVWRLFTDALKQGKRRRALRMALARPANAAFVLAGLARAVPRRVQKYARRALLPVNP